MEEYEATYVDSLATSTDAHPLRRLGSPSDAIVRSVCTAFPSHYYDQEALLRRFRELWGKRFRNADRIEQLHRSVRVEGRHLALPMEETAALSSFGEANDAYIRCAVDLGSEALGAALADAGLEPRDVDHIFFVSITGIATPSIDARIVNRLGLRSDVRRTPIFGLGCVAGAAGLARASDWLRAYPDRIAALVSVELCSLTLQRGDPSVRNLIASGLFGDGAAAVILGGGRTAGDGPRILDSRSAFFPDTEDVMGWNVGADGFSIVLSADVPAIVHTHVRPKVESFLRSHGLTVGDISTWVCHPGGPKVLLALQEALNLPADALEVTWDSLRRVGNLSSASVLMVLQETMRDHTPAPGSFGMVLGMGPGFCAEMVLVQW